MLLHDHSNPTRLSPENLSDIMQLGTGEWSWSLPAAQPCHWKTKPFVSSTTFQPAPGVRHRPNTFWRTLTLAYSYTANIASYHTLAIIATQQTVSWTSYEKDLMDL